MPMSRYRIRDEYSLADPELYRAVDKDDSGALLEGVAMAGLVGVLRQLGDLADFAAEIFHDLHEEVMATAARGHSLTVRVQQLEEELPLIEKEFLSRTNQSSFFYNAGTDWHPNLPLDQNMVTRGDLPRHVMESYEECRGPPRLFLLDKFDVAGAGSCLKRYTDPSFFKREASYIKISNLDVQRETKPRKAKKKGSRSKNGKTPELLSTSHAKLHQLLLEERNETGGKDSEHHVKLRRRLNGFPFDSKTEKSYMEKLLETPSVGQKPVHEVFVDSLSLKLPSRVASETGLDIVENSAVNVNEEVAVSINEEVTWTNRNTSPSPSQSEDTVAPISPNDTLNEIATYDEYLEISNQSLSVEAGYTLHAFHNVSTDGEISVDGDRQDTTSGYQSDDISSGIDDYMDAPTSMGSELDLESEMNPNKDLHVKSSKFSATNDERLQSESSDSLSIRNSMLSDDENGSSKKEICSFFNSGSSSTSPEMAHLEGEVAAKDFAITGNRVQMCDSHLQTTDDGFSSAQPLEDAFDNDTCAKTAGINRQSSDFGEPMTRPTIPGLVSISGYADEEAIVIKDALTEPVRNEIFSTLGECENDYVCVVENAANPTAPRTLEVQGRTGEDPPTRVSDENQDEIINNHATSAVNPDNVSSNAGDDTPIPLSTDNEHECNLDVGHLNPSNNLSITSSIFNHISQNRDELFSAKNGLLDRLNDKGPNFVENPTCLHKLSDSPSSNKDDHSSSSSVISCSSDGNDQNISTDASLHVPNTLEISLEECAKNSLQIVSEEEIAETNHSGASDLDDIPVCSNLSITQAEIESVGSILEIETDNASLKYNERLTNAIPNGAEQRVFDVIHEVDCPTNLDYVETHISAEDAFLPLDSGERGISQIGQECLDEILSARTGETMDHIAYGYPESVSEEPAVLNATMTEAYQLNVGDATGSVDSTDDVKVNASSYMDIKKFQDDSISCSDQFTQNKLRIASLCFPGSHKESDKLNVGHHAIISPISDSVSHDIAGYSPLQCNVLPSDLDKVTCVATGQSVLDMEPISSSGNNLTNVIRERIPCENLDKGSSDDALSLPTHHCIEENVELAHIQLDEGLVGKGEANNELSPLQERTQVLERTVATSSRLMPESLPSQPLVSKLSSHDNNSLDLDKDPQNPLTCMSPGFALFPGNNQISPEEMPPLPPLPPVQWRLGKVQLASPALERNVVQRDTGLLSTFQSKIDQTVQPLEQIFPPVIAKESSPDFYESAAYNMEHSGPLSLPVSHAVLDENSDDSFSFPTTTHSSNPHLSFSGPDSDNLHTSLVQKRGTLDPLYSIPQLVSVDKASMLDIGTSPEELIQPAQQAAEETLLKVRELEEGYKCSVGNLATNDRIRLQASSEDSGSTGDSKSVEKEETQSLDQVAPETSLNELNLPKHDTSLEANFITTDAIPSALTVENEKPLHAIRDSEVEIVQPAVEDGIVNGSQKVKHPGAQSPSIETVAAFDRSRLRKVTDQVKNQARKVDERDSLLELIRTKSFNLRPTVAARPNIQGPQTNLRVVAILERAKTIRQAFAGSDEDDNEDSWSDS
nr:protein SCAR2-like isoform X1 [Ipomoea batatas]